MSEISNEIKESLKDNFRKFIKKPSVLITLTLVLGLGGGFVLYKVLAKPDVKIGTVADEIVWNDYDNMMVKLKDNQVFDDLLTEPDQDRESDSLNDATYIETTIASFFYYANQHEVDLWLSYITQERLTQDFDNQDLMKRLDMFDEAVEGISRGGKIEAVSIVKASRLLGGTARIVLEIKYTDLPSAIRTNIEIQYNDMKPFNDVLGESYNIPLIHSSIWDLVKDIELKENNI